MGLGTLILREKECHVIFFERMVAMMNIISITNTKKQYCGKLLRMSQSSFFLMGFDYVTNGHVRSVEQHPGAGEFHNFLNSFSHILLVAMHLAVGAEGLCLHKGAEVAALCGIGIQFRAFRTKGVTAVLLAAVQRNHVGNHFFFFLSFCLYIH